MTDPARLTEQLDDAFGISDVLADNQRERERLHTLLLAIMRAIPVTRAPAVGREGVISMWFRNECEREGAEDYRRDRHPSYERSRDDWDDRCYFEGYDAAKREHDRCLDEERAQEEAAEARAAERRREARLEEERYEQAMYEQAQEEQARDETDDVTNAPPPEDGR